MKPAKYHPLARSELIASALFYDERNRGLGERFLQGVEATEASICEHPLWGQPFEVGTRKQRVKKISVRFDLPGISRIHYGLCRRALQPQAGLLDGTSLNFPAGCAATFYSQSASGGVKFLP